MLMYSLATGCQRCAFGPAVRSPDPNEVPVSSPADSAAYPPARMAPAPDPPPTAPASDEAPARVAPRRGVVAVAWTNFTENFFSTVFVGIIVGVAMFGLGVVNDNLNARFTAIDNRFADIDARFAAVDARFNKLEDDIDARFIRLEGEIDARFTKLEENQLEMALTLTRVVALLEARGDAEPAPVGH